MPLEKIPTAQLPAAKPGPGARIPGLLVCLAGGGLSWLAAQVAPVSALLIAILLGALWRNLAPVPAVLDAGVQVSGRRLLRLGIVLLGLQLSLSGILGLGPGVLVVVALSVGVTFGASLLIGKWLGLAMPQRLLIAAGFSICGAAAVAACAGTVKATREQVATAIGLVVLFGTLLIPLGPALGMLVGFDDEATGMFIGAATHEVAQVVAAGGAVGASALAVAVTVKLARVLLLAPVMAGVGLYMRRTHSMGAGTRPPLVPLFVAGFMAAVLLRSTGVLPEVVLDIASWAQTFLLATAMFALGLGVHLRSIIRTGGRSLVLAAAATVVIILVSLAGTALFPPAG
ncbi:putative sulfate exporter family transporter [Glutamicibacter sp. MNS18]|uniref:YeiH family protein n=1 Tax=Glutamicibacter sp. MNS18 TaxID=2989817 RepID=UPI00223544FF|nr:putative sulfate exporter family transporter [Glutamicibacter sp. MNS18]MCW4466559.1 putative sulfate exporter family transporter [Glutamicibacter sp. MNS18]